MADLTTLLAFEVGGNHIADYVYSIGAFIVSMIVLRIFKYIILNKLKKLSLKTESKLDDLLIGLVDRIKWPFYVFLSVYIGFHFIAAPELITKIMKYGIVLVVTYYSIRGVESVIEHGAQEVIKKRKKDEPDLDTSIIDFLKSMLKVVVWVIAFLFLLAHFGYNISTLAAGLGIGGIAIAFALQNVLSDIFASFSIYFDKPFKVGDNIVIGTDAGIVKKIGIKSTRIQTIQGQELIVPNKELTGTRVNNFKNMEKRKVIFTFGVVNSTSSEKLKRINSIISGIIKNIKLAEIERVHFKQFGEFSLVFEVAYIVNSSDLKVYLDVQQEINFAIKEQFEKEGIEIAYPTQTLIVKNKNVMV